MTHSATFSNRMAENAIANMKKMGMPPVMPPPLKNSQGKTPRNKVMAAIT